jgi:hypothetical protein
MMYENQERSFPASYPFWYGAIVADVPQLRTASSVAQVEFIQRPSGASRNGQQSI